MKIEEKSQNISREEILAKIIKTETFLHSIQDVDVLLEQILAEARSVVNADAGSIYVASKNRLAIQYAQNDTLQRRLPPGQKLPYGYFEFPIDNSTIAGCSAGMKKLINVPDVYHIGPDKPYKFGKETDMATGYKTVSNLTIPLLTISGMLLGVLQVLNALDENGKPHAFTSDDEIYLTHFASNASVALERTLLTRSMIMRMIKMAELRDPRETGMHVNRVANYAVEIYDRWAFNNSVPQKERNDFRDALKIAAMLHDVGKIAIPDEILKKNGRLTDEEFAVMQTHTWLGARLFNKDESNLDRFSSEIALNHHENWDGSGYPGFVNPETGEPLKINAETGKPQGKAGEEIPLGARIVSLADVYDALSSRRSYKDAWEEEQILNEIKSMSGIKFDPEIVKAFFEILPFIHAIKKRFRED